MLQDDQIAVAAQASTCIHHAAIRRRQHGVARLAGNVKALVARFVKASDQRTRRGPDECQLVLTRWRCRRCWSGRCYRHHRARCRRGCGLGAAGGRCRRRSRRAGRSDGRRRDRACHHAIFGSRHSRRGCRRWQYTQHLTDFDQVGILQIVPAGDVFPALPGLQANANQGIPRLDRVVARLASIFCAWQRLDGGGHHHAGLGCGGGSGS